MDLKRRAIDALPVDGQVPGMDLYAGFPPSVPTPTRLLPRAQAPQLPQQGMMMMQQPPPQGMMYHQQPPQEPVLMYHQQGPPIEQQGQQPQGVAAGVMMGAAGLGPGSSGTETIPQRFRKASDMVESRFTWQRRWRHLAFAKEALPWAGAALLIACMIMVVTRPSFVYSRADEFTAPQFSLQRLAILSLLTGLVTFGIVLYGMSATLL